MAGADVAVPEGVLCPRSRWCKKRLTFCQDVGEQSRETQRAWPTEESGILNERNPGRGEEAEGLDVVEMSSCFSCSVFKTIDVFLALTYQSSPEKQTNRICIDTYMRRFVKGMAHAVMELEVP